MMNKEIVVDFHLWMFAFDDHTWLIDSKEGEKVDERDE